MYTKHPQRGFTLIELLVVIAIIGILSSVVLASLSTARTKGSDAAVKADLNGLRAQADIFYDSNNFNYAGGTGVISSPPVGGCPTTKPTNTSTNYGLMGDQTFFSGVTAAKAASGGLCAYINNGANWAVAVQLKENNYQAWCIDSTGTAKVINNSTTAYTQTALNADITSSGCGT